jgi:hypothetical protein
MIRLPPSAIILGPSDLKDFEIRQKRSRALDAEGESLRTKEYNAERPPLTSQIAASRKSPAAGLRDRGEKGSHAPRSTGSSPEGNINHPTLADLTEDKSEHPVTGYYSSPENGSTGAPLGLASKNDSPNVGFLRGPTQQVGSDTFQPSSPFSTFATLLLKAMLMPS